MDCCEKCKGVSKKGADYIFLQVISSRYIFLKAFLRSLSFYRADFFYTFWYRDIKVFYLYREEKRHG